MRSKFNCIIGYSDHSGSIESIIYAISKSIPIIEFHVKFKEDVNNLDNSSSINFKDLKFIKKINDVFYIFKTNKINNNILNKNQKKISKLFTKSLAVIKDIKKNQKIKKSDLTLKKPGTGIKFSEIKKIIGKKIIRNVSSKRILKWSDLK
jgi:N,N'-diacetyllegionaminate synthase